MEDDFRAPEDDERESAQADDDMPDGYEECYADGSLKNECWNSRREE